MKPVILLSLCMQLACAYHDPDLNYHLSQIQKVISCENSYPNGYTYSAPPLQLSNAVIKVVAPPAALSPGPISRFPSHQYLPAQTGYQTGITYQTAAPKYYFAAQPSPVLSKFASTQGSAINEVHGYATSAGLSSATTSERPITPSPTYAHAPILSKMTGAPLVAKFDSSPAKTPHATQNLIQQHASHTGSLAKASLNYGNLHLGGLVVSQVYPAPDPGYATSSDLKLPQNPQFLTPNQFQQLTQTTPAITHFMTSHGHFGAASTASKQYFTPLASQQFARIPQYSTHTINRQVTPVVSHYASPIVQQYSHPAILSRPAFVQYASPAVTGPVQYASGPISGVQVLRPAVVNTVTRIAAPPLAMKNLHTEFVQNYDANPRYAYHYSVNDPHTGDIKHQKESRDGEVVKGHYSLVEPDGSVRTVNYHADWDTGFHADVHNSKNNHHYNRIH